MLGCDHLSPICILDNCIESWSPDNKGMKSKLVGKNNHLDNLRTRIDPTIPKELVTLIDDNMRNCELVSVQQSRLHCNSSLICSFNHPFREKFTTVSNHVPF
jgi:hypothetical protein